MSADHQTQPSPRAATRNSLEERLVEALTASSEQERIVTLAALRSSSGEAPFLLAEVASDSNSPVNVKAMAARALFGSTKVALATVPDATLNALITNTNPLIRHGVLLGFGDAADWESVRTFLEDEHPLIQSEANELLEDQAM